MKGKTKIRPATKIGIGAVVVVTALFLGYRGYNVWRVSGLKFDPLPPAAVNIVGIDTGAGYYVIVANNMAHLVRGANTGTQHTEDYNNDSGVDQAEKKRVPMRELLESLQGNEKALGRFIMVMNDINEGEFPAYPNVWKAEDIKKALDGDTELVKKLERDINVKLDGTPLDSLTVKAIEEGIVVDSPVSVMVQVGKERKKLIGRVQESYTPRFILELQKRYQDKAFYNVQTIRGFYATMAKDVLDGKMAKEDIRGALQSRISESRLQMLAERPEVILKSASVIVNDTLIEKAELNERPLPDGRKVYDIELHLTDEGRMRLWQFSLNKVGSQILVIWDGNAIAAPTVQHELSQSTVTVKGVGDYRLAKSTVDAINNKAKGGS